jgi:ABC-2 type transport system ATP-binding protein
VNSFPTTVPVSGGITETAGVSPERAPAETVEPPVVRFEDVSKWYGPVIGVNRLTLSIPKGITGLLGPNGAGKSTLLQLATGQLRASQGDVTVLDQEVWGNALLLRRIGLCPEQDAFWEWMTGRDFVTTCAQLSGLHPVKDAVDRAITLVRMGEHQNRAIRGYSKGMRQRIKLAQALVHDPEVLFLDEPLTGTDPLARRDLMDIILGLAADGKTIVVSSHVLYEVQSLTKYIILLNRGRLVAEGSIRSIRDLIDKYPHRIVLVCDRYRELAARLVSWEDVEGIQVLRDQSAVRVETRVPDAFYGRLPGLVAEGTAIREVYSDDDNLEAVFKYLVKS